MTPGGYRTRESGRFSGDIDDDHSVPSGDLSPDLVRMEVRMPEEPPNGKVTVMCRSKQGQRVNSL